MKKNAPLIIAFVVGIFMIVEFFIPHHFVKNPADLIKEWGKVIAGATFLLGIMSLIHVNIPVVFKRGKDWQYKLVLLIGFGVMMFLGLYRGPEGRGPDSAFQYIFMTMMRPMGATMFAILAFYIASAAFRAFRARTVEATLMLVAAILVMFGRVPLGELVFNPLTAQIGGLFGMRDPMTIVDVMEWIMNVPNLAGKRAILIGAALGIMSTSLRIILGLERSYMGGGE